MVRKRKTFRIFVSSTFSDLEEERNALQERVFPRLRELCMKHDCRFQAIDLRWGVREDAALNQQTMRICFEEIARYQRNSPRPNFILLLGDRYGWCPLPYEVPAKEFEQILENISGPDDKALLSHWYRRDDNAVPPVYDLQPQTGEYVDPSRWKQVERRLRSILLLAIKVLSIEPDKRLKYIASATEQETVQGAFQVPDSSEHIFCFFRTIQVPQENGSICPIKDAALGPDFRDFKDLDPKGNLDQEAHAQLNDLKSRLSNRLPGNLYNYEAQWRGSGVTTDHIEKLCEDVYASLSKVIEREVANLEEVDPLDQEISDHDAFGKDRAEFFTGRTAILKTISAYLKRSDHHPMAVFGSSGSGKTALMAKSVEQAEQNYPDANVIFRFIGATPGSSDGRTLLESLCHQISRVHGMDESAIPSDYRDLVQEFPKRLAAATEKKPLILFLDALNQLSETDHAQNLAWLLAELPVNVKVIVSAIGEDSSGSPMRDPQSKIQNRRGESFTMLERKLPQANLIELEPMPLNEGADLLGLWLKDTGRTLTGHQWNEVTGKFAGCGLPLYLKLAFEEARRWKSYGQKVALSADIPGIIRDLYNRLSSNANHGQMMVSRSLGYLAAAKNGLTEDELLDVLSLDEEVLRDFRDRAYHEPPEERLPVVVWSRLCFDLVPYLTERTSDGTSLLAFYHHQLAEAVTEEFLAGEAKAKRHEGLARYFSNQVLWIEKDGKKTPSLRKVSELLYQQIHGELWDEVETTLCDLRFIEAKCAAGRTYDLIADYTTALVALPETREEKRKELKHQERLRKYTQDLIAYAKGESKRLDIIPSVDPRSKEKTRDETERIITNPTRIDRIRAFSQFVNYESQRLFKFAFMKGFCLQQAYNYAKSGPVADEAKKWAVNVKDDLNLIVKAPSFRYHDNPHPALIRTFDYSFPFFDVNFTGFGKKFVAVSYDRTLFVGDTESGQILSIFPLKAPRGLSFIFAEGDLEYSYCDKLALLTCTPDGNKALSVGSGLAGTAFQLWDLLAEKCKTIGKNNKDVITSIDMTPDGRRAVSGCTDGTFSLWDLKRGQCIKTISAHKGGVTGLVIAPGGNVAVSVSEDKRVCVWNLQTGENSKTLEGHTDRIEGVSMTPDGNWAISGGRDCNLRLWDLEKGECSRIFSGHNGDILNVAITPDGIRAISGGRDKTLRLWDLERGEGTKGHDRLNRLVRVTDMRVYGKKAVTGKENGEICIFDLERGNCSKTIKAHENKVFSIAITPDGRRIISGSKDRHLKAWDLEMEKPVSIIDNGAPIISLALTPDGKRAISGSLGPALSIWDLQTERCLGKTECVPLIFYDIAITPDGKRGVSGGDNVRLWLWDIEKGEILRTLVPQWAHVTTLSITPNGKRVVAGGRGVLWLWDLVSGNLIDTFVGHHNWINSVKVTPDGRRAISGSVDKTIRVWNLESGECEAIHYSGSSVRTMSEIDGGRHLAYGTEADEFNVLVSRCFMIGPPLTTSCRIWLNGRRRNIGRWDDEITSVCQWCGQRFPVLDKVLDVIRAIAFNVKLSPAQSPCLELPNEAWDEPNLLSECPICHKPLKFNPFIVDNRGWY